MHQRWNETDEKYSGEYDIALEGEEEEELANCTEQWE